MKNNIVLRFLGAALCLLFLIQLFPQQIGNHYIGFTVFLTGIGFFVTTRFLTRVKNKQSYALADTVLRILTHITLPMVGMMLLMISLASLLSPFYLTRINEQFAAAIGFVSNIYEIQRGGWGSDIALANLFFHLTRLAIAIQLVFIWSVIMKLTSLIKTARLSQMKTILFLAGSGLLLVGISITLYKLFITHENIYDVMMATTSSFLPFFVGAVGAIVCDDFQLSHLIRKNNRQLAGIHLTLSFLLLFLINWFFQPISQKTYLIGLLLSSLLSLYSILCWKAINTQKDNVRFQQSLLSYGYACYLFVYPLILILSNQVSYRLSMIIATILTLSFALGYLIIKKRIYSAGSRQNPYKKETIWIRRVSLLAIIFLIFLAGFKMKQAPKLNPITTETASTHLQKSVTNLNETYDTVNKIVTNQLITDWKDVLKNDSASVDIAVYSPKYDQLFSYTSNPDNRTFYTASIAKVSILTELLHQKDVAGLSEETKSAADEMITYSSNEDATVLLTQELGSMTATNKLFETLEMTDSVAGDTSWGITVTSARDQVKLLRVIFDPESTYLSSESKKYAQQLMGNVTAEQSWGITTDADYSYVKNGWLPEDGEWIVNSIGCVSPTENPMDGYLIAILTNGVPSMEEGQQLIEQLALTTKGCLFPS